MFLDYLYNLPNETNLTSGLDNILIQTAVEVSSLIPLLLLFVYAVVFLGGIIRQKARLGTADYPMWSVVGSLAVFMIALISSVIQGLIRLDWLAIVIVLNIFSFTWLALDRRSNEI